MASEVLLAEVKRWFYAQESVWGHYQEVWNEPQKSRESFVCLILVSALSVVDA